MVLSERGVPDDWVAVGDTRRSRGADRQRFEG